jgi:hypothetical protein
MWSCLYSSSGAFFSADNKNNFLFQNPLSYYITAAAI